MHAHAERGNDRLQHHPRKLIYRYREQARSHKGFEVGHEMRAKKSTPKGAFS